MLTFYAPEAGGVMIAEYELLLVAMYMLTYASFIL
jgi:hypothetical protein